MIIFFYLWLASSLALAGACDTIFSKLFGFHAPETALVALGHARETALPSEFSLLLWNIEKAQDPRWHESFARMPSDLFFLQEVNLNPGVRQTLEATDGQGWKMATSFVKDGARNGVATGSRVAPVKSAAFQSPVVEPIVHTPKTAMVTEYPLAAGGENLLAVNLHAINFVTTSRFRRHLREIFSRIALHSGPVLFAGDMNTWSPGRLRYLRKKAAEIGLSEVKPPSDPRRLKLDRVFVRGLKVVDSQVLTEVDVSDHYPLRYQFKVE